MNITIIYLLTFVYGIWLVCSGWIQTFSEEVNDGPNIILNNKEYYGCGVVHSMLPKLIYQII